MTTANLPNYADPDTMAQIEFWERTKVSVCDPDGKTTIRQATPTCPVCRYAMAERGDPRNRRVVCTWDPEHTNPQSTGVEP